MTCGLVHISKSAYVIEFKYLSQTRTMPIFSLDTKTNQISFKSYDDFKKLVDTLKKYKYPYKKFIVQQLSLLASASKLSLCKPPSLPSQDIKTKLLLQVIKFHNRANTPYSDRNTYDLTWKGRKYSIPLGLHYRNDFYDVTGLHPRDQHLI